MSQLSVYDFPCHQVPGRPFGEASEAELVSEFLQQQEDGRQRMAPTSFHMDSLLREMHEIEGARHRHAPLPGWFAVDVSLSSLWYYRNKKTIIHIQSVLLV